MQVEIILFFSKLATWLIITLLMMFIVPEKPNVSHWDLSSKEYIGPTGDNHAVYQSEWSPWRTYNHEWPELTKKWE